MSTVRPPRGTHASSRTAPSKAVVAWNVVVTSFVLLPDLSPAQKMSRPSISTPCPAPARQFDALPSFDEQDDTSQIEYTRVIQREFAHARPRRPTRREIGPKVYEDVAQEEESRQIGTREEHGRGSMLLGRKPTKRVPMGGIGQGRAHVAPLNPIKEDEARLQLEEGISTTGAARKESRRRTIYVPSDDTTLMTIHPGANTTNRLDDTFQLPTCQPQSLLDCIAHSPPSADERHHNVPVKKTRMSLAAAPRRVPLGQMEAKSTNVPAVDRKGNGGGKENFPPKLWADCKLASKSAGVKSAEPINVSAARSKAFEPTAASRSRQSVHPRHAMPITKAKTNPRATTTKTYLKAHSSHNRAVLTTTKPAGAVERRTKEASPRVKAPAQPKPWRKSANFVSASDASKAKLQRYQILNEDISRPELYEDSWLDQQEVALTEVVNQIFADAEPNTFSDAGKEQSMRESFLEIYDQPQVAMLHKRLQASLSYGALSKPKEMPPSPDLTQDLGLRRRFVQLWMESYNLELLCAAAEVVVGRKMPSQLAESAERRSSTSKSMDPKESRRAVIGFLETFFVTVDDLDDSHAEREDVTVQRRSKTVLRSLMLIWLLDQGVSSRDLSKRLFKIKSAHKTSSSVLNALAGMLIPSTGDIVRTLKHMEYTISYTQDPLDEVVYRIDNLAVDLRDGVMLTKLVELLLYNTPSNVWDRLDDTREETVTIVLPDATVLQSALYAEDGSQQDRVLVQHLKMPCVGHAQKVYNVDIALQALACHPRTADIISADITAETIVNGHRENTLNLLWSLVSSIGLDILLDKKALIADITHQDPSNEDIYTLPIDALLQKWAAVYCLPEALHITNLTTSFADGTAYSAIVAAFSNFFAPASSSRSSLGNSTASRLRAMGCSDAFVKQLTSTTTAIPTRQTTLANLAFLASRLLPLSRRFHAAVTLQRAFRAKHAWVVLKQRAALMRMAADCAEVVRAQQKLSDAAITVQRRWRAIESARVERLDRDVLDFQIAARGWLQRRRITIAKRSGQITGRRAAGW